MSKTIIQVDNLNKIFKLPHEKFTSVKGLLINPFSRAGKIENQHVLKDISFEVKEGEFLGIVGRNGSGKSTLLKLLAGIYTPTSGNVTVNGRLTPFIELGVGFSPELTGRENVFLNGALLGFSRKDMNEMYDEIVEFSELSRFMDQKLKNYSSGMQVRLAFSIAIRAKSDVLLIDEVLAVGDAAFQQKCFKHFMDLKANKQTVVFISHDMGAIKRFCDRSIAIEAGIIASSGSNNKVTDYYQKLLSGVNSVTKDKPRRIGTGEMLIDNVKIINSQSKKTNKISSKEDFSIEFDYSNPNNLTECIFGIGITNQQGINVIGPNTKKSLGKMITLNDKGHVKCRFRPTYLTNGKYEIIVSAHNIDETVAYELVINAEEFKIADNKGYGAISDTYKWEVT